jgi:hypothetical protein
MMGFFGKSCQNFMEISRPAVAIKGFQKSGDMNAENNKPKKSIAKMIDRVIPVTTRETWVARLLCEK